MQNYGLAYIEILRKKIRVQDCMYVCVKLFNRLYRILCSFIHQQYTMLDMVFRRKASGFHAKIDGVSTNDLKRLMYNQPLY